MRAAVGRVNLFGICFDLKYPGGWSHLVDAQMEELCICLELSEPSRHLHLNLSPIFYLFIYLFFNKS